MNKNKLHIILLSLLSSFLITSCNQEVKETETFPKKEKTYYPNGNIKEKFYVDHENLKQGSYQKFYEKGGIEKSCYFYNDTTIGFTSFFNSNGKIKEKKSTIYLDGEITTGEFFTFEYDSLDQAYILGAFFHQELISADTFLFMPNFKFNYDSIIVSVAYRGCLEETKIHRYKYGKFTLPVPLSQKKCRDLEIRFNLRQLLPNNQTLVQEIQRVYPIKDGQIISSHWDL